MYSLLDSCTDFKDYVDYCVDHNIKAICFSEHGNIFQHIAKKIYCDSKGIKYLHGCEVYLTATNEEKNRDNYHTILIAKNFQGYLELNALISLSSHENHFYYKPRITFDEFFNISDNIFKISACLASPLNHQNDIKSEIYDKLCQTYDYYEIQYHNVNDQIEYNKHLYDLSLKYNKPLIAGTDTHSLNQYKAECRKILMKAKHIEYSNEDEFDLTMKSPDEIEEVFRIQNSLPQEIYMQAIMNTNIMAEQCENLTLDTKIKYPIVSNDDEKDLRELIEKKYQEKLNKGIITDNPKYRENIEEEFRVFKKVGMLGFMLFMSQLCSWAKENNIPFGFCRGSVGGCTIAYIIDIIDVDPVKWNTIFSRFCNEFRTEIGDVDTDWAPNDRQKVYDYIIGRFGIDKAAYIISFGTITDKATIDEIGRALEVPLDEVKQIKALYDTKPEEARKKWSKLFYYFDGLLNTVVSQGIHPAGMVASPITLQDNYGVIIKDNLPIICIDMEEIHECGLAKYDILGLKNIAIIKDCCEMAKIPYPRSDQINWEDENVWNDITTSAVGIFQFEAPYAFDLLKKFNPHKINDLSLVNAALRPSGASYRDDLLTHKIHKNPSPLIDELLKDNYGFLVFQEDTIAFLQKICGLTGSEADNVRRAIGRKQKDRLESALPQILEGYCNKSSQPKKIAEQEAKEFLQIIEDSSNYQFGFNHSTGYSMIGYLCAYLRYYYPMEFICAYLNNAKDQDDIADGTELAKVKGIKVLEPKFGYSKSEYMVSKETMSIYKGMGSIKFLNPEVANALYELAKNSYKTFAELLGDIKQTGINSRQLEILIKLDFFDIFGNSKELMTLVGLFDTFKWGDAKQISKSKVDKGTYVREVLEKYCTQTDKKYIISDRTMCLSILVELEKMIKEDNLIYDYSLKDKIQWQQEYLGYISSSGRKEDNRVLIVKDISPVKRKSDGKQFGYGIIFQSVGTGKQTRMTALNPVYKNCGEIRKGDVVYCIDYAQRNGYYNITKYKKIE